MCLQTGIYRMENKRLTDISYLRTFAIIAIVLYHSFCPYMDWKFVSSSYNPIYNSIFKVWFGARMPLFLFISGFLFSYLLFVKNKYNSFGGFVWNKTKRLLIPYIFFATLIMLSHDKLSWVYLKNGYWHLWFLLTLFWCFVVTRFLKKIDYPLFHILFLIAVTCLSLFVKTKIKFGINHFVFEYVYFFWGYVLARYRNKLTMFFEKKCVILFFVSWLVLNFLRMYYGAFNMYLMYASNITFIFFVYGLLQQLLQGGWVKENLFVETMNKYSYGIYVFHAWLISLLFLKGNFYSEWIYGRAIANPIAFPILLFVFVFGVSMLITHFLLKTKTGRFLIG